MSFNGTLTARLASAYYRAKFGGTSAFQPSVSSPLLRWKYLSEITSFSVSPRSTHVNSYVTASGRLWYDSKSWRPYAHQQVMILFHYKNKWYYYPRLPRTSSSGRFSGEFQIHVSAHWAAQYDGNTTHFASASALVQVSVTGHGAAARIAPPASAPRMAGPASAPRMARPTATARTAPRARTVRAVLTGRRF